MKAIGRIRATLAAVAVAGALGFGATQAVAAPGERAKALWCYEECYKQCGPALGTMTSNGVCICCG